uniref:DUF4537 domain-containing protein n=3 Tax=Macrostomum lignano TaxID=282301 RepID=A0A1I8GIU5_9PLAT
MTSPPPPLHIRGLPQPGLFGDLTDRRVVFALESSARLALVMPKIRQQIADALLRLAHRSGETAFGLVVGSRPTVYGAEDRLTAATPESVAEAVNWLSQQPCRSIADHLASLLAAFRPTDCQAVWLVAGSAPASAAESEAVLDHATYLSRGRPVHCVCLRLPGDQDDGEAARLIEFMDRLAAETCGSLTAVTIDEAQSISAVQRLRGSDGPAERMIRTKDGRIRPELATCSITTCLSSGVDPLLEPPLLPPPAGLKSFSRHRPARAFISASGASGAGVQFRNPFCPAGGATLIGRRVLARRRDPATSGFFRGKVVSEVEPDLFLVEFPADEPDEGKPQHQETRISDIVSLDDALRHSIAPDDAVLLPPSPGSSQPAKFQLGIVRSGHEARDFASAGADVTPLIVAVTTTGEEAEVEAAAGQAVWIPRQLYDSLLAEKVDSDDSANSKQADVPLRKSCPTVILYPPGLMYVYPTASLAAPLLLNSGSGREFPIRSHPAPPLYSRPLHPVVPASASAPPPPVDEPAAEAPTSTPVDAPTSVPDAPAAAAAATAEPDNEEKARKEAADEEAELLALDRELAAALATSDIGVGNCPAVDDKRRKKPTMRRRQRPPWRYWGAGGVGCGINSSSGMPDVIDLHPTDPHVNWGRCDVLEHRLNPADKAKPRLRPDSPRRLLDPRLYDRFGDPADHRMTREQAAASASAVRQQRRWTAGRGGFDDAEATDAILAARSRHLVDAQVQHELHRLDRQERSAAAAASLESAIKAQLQREALAEAQAYRLAVQEELRRGRSGGCRFDDRIGHFKGAFPAVKMSEGRERVWQSRSAGGVAAEDAQHSRLVENSTAQRTVAHWLRYQDLMDPQQAAASAQTMAARHRDCHSALESQRLLRQRQEAI